ncbi:MAG: hypothetical protein ACXVR1_08525 [Solirubrobacteraceae bacterium]
MAIAIIVLIVTPGIAVAGMVGIAALILLAVTAASQRRRARSRPSRAHSRPGRARSRARPRHRPR